MGLTLFVKILSTCYASSKFRGNSSVHYINFQHPIVENQRFITLWPDLGTLQKEENKHGGPKHAG